MSLPFRHHRITTADRASRGQSFVEFALVLPMLLVLLLGIADFGRVFAAGITLEAIARNAAEAAAQEYLQLARNAPTVSAVDYGRIHDVALQQVCREAERLSDEVDADDDGVCEMPSAAVCVHDLPPDPADTTPPPGDPSCGSEAGSSPSACTEMAGPWSNIKPLGQTQLAFVEVRVCYRFSTLFPLDDLDLPFGSGLSLGDIWLQRDRAFTVADY
jgi:hypothetical protein